MDHQSFLLQNLLLVRLKLEFPNLCFLFLDSKLSFFRFALSGDCCFPPEFAIELSLQVLLRCRQFCIFRTVGASFSY